VCSAAYGVFWLQSAVKNAEIATVLIDLNKASAYNRTVLGSKCSLCPYFVSGQILLAQKDNAVEAVKILVIVLQVIAALAVIVLVLLQQGKGADAGAAFGSGSSGSVFGAVGSANFLSRSTAWMATVFIVCTVLLAFGRWGGSGSVLESAAAPAKVELSSPAAKTTESTDNIPK
jgi:preprotein translocase subunit SecG